MFKKLVVLGFVVASLPMIGCGSSTKEIEATIEEAPMDPEVMNKMAQESMSRMPPEQQAQMKRQLEAEKAKVKSQ